MNNSRALQKCADRDLLRSHIAEGVGNRCDVEQTLVTWSERGPTSHLLLLGRWQLHWDCCWELAEWEIPQGRKGYVCVLVTLLEGEAVHFFLVWRSGDWGKNGVGEKGMMGNQLTPWLWNCRGFALFLVQPVTVLWITFASFEWLAECPISRVRIWVALPLCRHYNWLWLTWDYK